MIFSKLIFRQNKTHYIFFSTVNYHNYATPFGILVTWDLSMNKRKYTALKLQKQIFLIFIFSINLIVLLSRQL
jgi:hypothetical protein